MRKEKGPLLLLYERIYVVLLVTAAAVVAAWLVTRSMTPVYRAQTKGYLPTSTDYFSLSQEGAALPTGPRLPTASDTLQASLLGLLRSAEIRNTVAGEFPERTSLYLQRNVEFDIDKFNLLVITAWDTDPAQARDITNVYFRTFEEELEKKNRTRMAEHRRVLEVAVEEHRQEMAAAQAAMLAFMGARSSVDYVAEFEALAARITSLRNSLSDLEISKATIDGRMDEVQRNIEKRPEWSPGSRVEVRNPRLVELDERIGRLRQEVEVMRLKYTDEHIQVRTKLKQIAEASSELATLDPRVEGSYTEIQDPIRQGLERDYMDLRIQEANLDVEVSARTEQLAELIAEWKAMPGYKAQLDLMEQDINELRKTLDLLYSRREELRILEARRASWLEITEVARAPLEHAYPKMSLNLAGAGLLGMVAGLTLVILMTRISTLRREWPW